MSALLQRIVDAIAAVRRHPVVTGALATARRLVLQAVSRLRQFAGHPQLRRLASRVARLVPARAAARWRGLRRDHPQLTGRVLPLAAAVILAMLWFSYDHVRVSGPGDIDLPDFAAVEQTDTRKEYFIEFLRPIVDYENERIVASRERLLQILAQLEAGDEVAADDHAWLVEQARLHRVKAAEDLARARALKLKIDIVPTSLALAQGALESAWGTSRFARQGNNLFGEWCFEPGCGIVPQRRPAQATYEVEAFDSVADSVRSYLRNLNSHPAYAPLRQIRAAARRRGRTPTGYELAAGLVNYAAIGQQYVEHLRAVIRRNNLQEVALAD